MKNGIQAQLWNGRKFVSGWMTWKAGCFEKVCFTPPSQVESARLHDFGRSQILPGFVDNLLHGFSGVDCGEGSASELERMARALAATGVTTALAGLYPMSHVELSAAAKRWTSWKGKRGTARTRFCGWHIEGPFLPSAQRGALPRKDLQKPSADAAQDLVDACQGWLRMCTIAPELRGSIEATEVLHAAKVIPSIGHSAAQYQDCETIAELGSVAITHLGNRLPPLSAREPGPIGFAMEGKATWVGVIPDRVHVAAETLRLWAKTPALKQSLMATSDNLSHAGLPAASFRAGGKKLHRCGAVARDAQENLSGTLDPLPELLLRAFRDGDLSLKEVVRLGCTVPGSVFADCGQLEPGYRADFLILEDDATIGPVWIGGRRVAGG